MVAKRCKEHSWSMQSHCVNRNCQTPRCKDLIAAKSCKDLNLLKRKLAKSFAMKDLGATN